MKIYRRLLNMCVETFVDCILHIIIVVNVNYLQKFSSCGLMPFATLTIIKLRHVYVKTEERNIYQYIFVCFMRMPINYVHTEARRSTQKKGINNLKRGKCRKWRWKEIYITYKSNKTGITWKFNISTAYFMYRVLIVYQKSKTGINFVYIVIYVSNFCYGVLLYV